MAVKCINRPLPNILMKSMRSIGYSFSTAIADVIDNSISADAKNIFLTTPISDNPDDILYVSILDDGCGMNDDELFKAMTYGTPREYSDKDLGRFGLGLKSASLSQCRVLIVCSKTNNKVNAYKWDLDFVEEDKEWSCLKLNEDEIKNIPEIEKLNDIEHGTLVVWENFDVLFEKSGGQVRACISEEMDLACEHIRLVFHRFLNNQFNPIHIFINGLQLFGFDPFLERHPKTDTRDSSKLLIDGSTVEVQPFILPHQNDLSNEDVELAGGTKSLRENQGFYIYRNQRLIIYGTWFRLSSDFITPELFKYGRIKVDIPNSLDSIWSIDIKKQDAKIPKKLVNQLKSIVQKVKNRSKEKTEKRARLTFESNEKMIWNKSKNVDNNKTNFFININSTFIREYLEEFNEGDKNKIIRLLEIISSKLPLDDIYSSMANNNCQNLSSQILNDELIEEGVCFFKTQKKRLQKDNSYIFELMSQIEPFTDANLLEAIKERVENEQ